MREVDVVLRDGSTVRVRPVRPEDEARYLAFLRALSEESRAMRYFVPTSETFLAEEARRETHVDHDQRVGLVATTGAEERIVGHAIFARRDGDRAEVAVAVADEYQGKGIGTILVGYLAEAAAARGVRVFEAEVMPANHRMVQLFRESGFPLEVNVKAGELHVRFPTLVTDEARAVFEQRERVASVNALHPFFQPRAVAVIGASRQRGTIGGELFHNLLSYGFNGPVYPVNPTAPVIQSVPAYPSVEAIPGPVDLAFIAVPAAHVNDVARQCARKGVRALVVISAGFAETGAEGRTRQAELVRICRAAGMRLIGPNCMGVVNTDPAVRLNGTFVPFTAEEGRIGFFSQSGALGAAIIDYTNALGLGLSTFVSVGNKADISGNDLISYWESDPRTGVILLYLESFGNPRKFSRIAQRAGRSKPIAAVKSGRSPAGARATSSHTGALVAASDITVDALFHQAGVIRTDTLEELFDVALLLINQPAPRGKRVGIITNGGGPGILCADACAAEGLEVPVLGEATQARLRTVLPPAASVTNPVDMVAAATADHYREVLRIVGADPAVDAVIVIFIPPLAVKTEDVAQAIVVAARDLAGSKPILSVFLAARGVPAALREADLHIPSFAFPEDAAIALARVARYGEWQAHPQIPPPALQGIRRDEAAAIVAGALQRGEGWLLPEEVQGLLSCYGLPLVRQQIVPSPEDAGAAAAEIGGTVALKAIAPEIVHKTEWGAVRLDLRPEEVHAAAEQMAASLATRGITPEGFLVQQMAPQGVEMLVGVVHDPQFGPVIACGAGGVLVELLRDVSVRLTPLNAEDAGEMIRSLKTYPLLTGFRGQPAYDAAALQDALLRTSAMVEDLPQVEELDCNPIMVLQQGAVVIDARVRVAPYEPPPLAAAREQA